LPAGLQVGLVAISLMCGGDGLADIVGRRWGAGARLPWNRAKSWPGSAAMFLGAPRALHPLPYPTYVAHRSQGACG
jgi:dolichol kinase